MNNHVRLGTLVLALGLAGVLAGCASQQSSQSYREPARDFEVVETSTKRQLTGREMAYLRAKVAEYLAQQGQTGSGDYYVKIFLGEEEGVSEGDWVVVRFTKYPSARFSLLASAPTYSYPYYPRYAYDYYPFGWWGFSAFTFRYYDDPYYHGYYRNYPWAYPPHAGHGRDRDGKPDRDRDEDRDKDRDRPRTDPRTPGGHRPTFVPANMVRARWNNNGNPPVLEGIDHEPRIRPPRPDTRRPPEGPVPQMADTSTRPRERYRPERSEPVIRPPAGMPRVSSAPAMPERVTRHEPPARPAYQPPASRGESRYTPPPSPPPPPREERAPESRADSGNRDTPAPREYTRDIGPRERN